MRSIKNTLIISIKSIILGFLIIFFLVFDKNIERIVIVCITYLICSIFKQEKFNIYFFNTSIITLIIGMLIGNMVLYAYVARERNNFLNNYYTFENEESTKPAVVLLAKGESTIYNSINIIDNIYSQNSTLDKILIPYNVFLHKIAYEELGNSKYNDLCMNIKNSLQENLGYEYDVFITYTNTVPNLSKELEGISKTYNKIILLPLFLYETQEYKDLIKSIKKDMIFSKTELFTMPLLWESDKLARQISKQTANLIHPNNRSLTGIILMSDNEPYNLDQKSYFLNNIIEKIEDYDFDSNKILIIDKNKNLENNIKNNVQRLQEKGINKIIIINTSDITQDMKNMWEIMKTIKAISHTENIEIKYIKGWGLGEDIINELEYQSRIIHLTE